ncbi:energy-coupling factor transporter transmembrane protein EcfT [Rhodobacterales bacterium]|nr:energy-coupling factor transporter transmembrane protein EcfT [Rhodobacterales bacterium]
MISMYLQGDSWAHRLPAGLKLLAVALGSLILFHVSSVWIFTGCLVAVVALYATLGREGLAQLRLLRGIVFFVVALLAIHWLSGSLDEGVVVAMRLVVMVLAANFVTITTRLDDMLDAVLPLFAPLKLFGVSPRTPALGVTLVLRFAPHLMLVFSRLREAWQARTARRSSWRLLAPFAIQSLRMSDNVAEALKARGGSAGLSSSP